MISPPPRHLRASDWLLAIIGLHLLIGLLYDWATPIFEASDEGAHFVVIRWIALGNGLPRRGDQGAWEHEGFQPPLYHALAAGLVFWVDMSDMEQAYVLNPYSKLGIPGTPHNANLFRHTASQRFPYRGTALAVHIVRWFSIGLSAATIWLTFYLALKVFPARERLALLAAALVAFNPKVVFVNASANNDNLLMLLSTAALIVMIDLMQPSVPRLRWKAALLGLLLSLVVLAKASGLVLWPVAALGAGWGVWRRVRGQGPGALRSLIIDFGLLIAGMFALALLLTSWWFWRNQRLYGQWLGAGNLDAIFGGLQFTRTTLFELIRDEWYGFYLSYWSVFGAFSILPPEWVHYFFHAVTLGAIVGSFVELVRCRLRPRAEPFLLALFCVLTFVGVVALTLQIYASQGRLLFGAIAPLSIFMAAGIMRLGSWGLKIGDWKFDIWNLAFGILTFSLALIAALIPVLYIAPHYASPPVIAETDLPANLRSTQVRFGDSIELIGYMSDDTPRRPGEAQPVTLYWRALKPMTADYALALHLLGRGATEVGKLDTWPGGGNLPTSQWTPGAIYADTYLIPIDPQAETPSRLNLYLSFSGRDLEDGLPIVAPSGDKLSTMKITVGRVIAPSTPHFSPAIVEGSTFEHGIKLLGVDVEEGGVVTLYWQTDGQVSGDYTVFLHLLANGVFLTQADAPPLGGDWPTSAWIPGQPLADVHQFELPPELPPGPYSLRLGFYDPATDARLMAFRQDGAEWPDDIVVIEDVEIK